MPVGIWDDDSNALSARPPMPAPLLIHVAPVTPTLAAGVRAIEVGPEQAAYVGNAAFNLHDAGQDEHSEPMAILANGKVIGFYRLDFAPNAVVGRSLGARHAGVRAFCIDRRHQGQGHGVRAIAAMVADIRRRHPALPLLVLAVHCRNRAGCSAWRQAGFVPTGELIPGGRAGPQYLMLLPLGSGR